VRTQSARRLYKIVRNPKILVTVFTFGIIGMLSTDIIGIGKLGF